MNAAYYDTNFLFKLQWSEFGSVEVRAHASTLDVIYCSLHGRAEFVSACHRKVREGCGTLEHLKTILAQLRADSAAGALQWLPVRESLMARLDKVYATAAPTVFLRAADALHLATAAEHGFSEIYSSDGHLLKAATLFGLRGVNVIGASREF
jgi:predicted nucleic acid-binding protein